MHLVWIAVAGAAGTLARYGLSGWIGRMQVSAFPWGTFAVNVLGSFALGFVFVLTAERLLASPTLRTVVMIGFLGAFTTFSTFSFETMRLIDSGAHALAVANVSGTVAATLAAVYAGTWLGRAL